MNNKNHNRRPQKKWVISTAILILTAAAVITGIQFHKKKNNVEAGTQKTTTVPLQKMNLTESISATGSLESANSAAVTAGLNDIQVRKVLVSVGDTVKKGDALVRFDQSDLKAALQDAQDNLADTKTNADREVSNASSQLTNAQETYQADQKKLANEVSSAKSELTNAKKTVKQLQKQLKKSNSKQNSTLEQQLTEAQDKQKQAQNAYDTAVSNQSSSNRQNTSSIDNAKSSLETAQSNRTKNIREAQKQVEEAQDNLDACAITAPIDGMITSLGVSQGDTYSGGTIAVIEDISSFVVTTSVDEYDISSVQVGQKAIIMTEATDQKEFEGQITFVAPSTSSSSNANSSSGDTPSTNAADSSSDGYEVQISLNPTEEERLKLGMTAKCSIILDEAVDVLAVPYDAVKGHGDQKYISVLEDENGEEKMISVTTGMETDYYIEVQGEELEEGMKVIIPSDQTTASDQDSDSKDKNGMGGFGFLDSDRPDGSEKRGPGGGNPGGGDSGDGNPSGGKPGSGNSGGAPGGNQTR